MFKTAEDFRSGVQGTGAGLMAAAFISGAMHHDAFYLWQPIFLLEEFAVGMILVALGSARTETVS